MKNFVQQGRTLTLVAPYNRLSGEGALVGITFGVAANDVLNGVAGEFDLEGMFDLTALNTATASAGAAAYWDNTNKRVDSASAGNTKIGVFAADKTNGPTVARVRLNGSF